MSPDVWTSAHSLDGGTSSHCRPIVGLVHIASGGLRQLALPPEALISSHCRPMGGPVHVAVIGFDYVALPYEVFTSLHFCWIVEPVRIAA